MSRKTAAELGITQEELDDLVWVRDALDPSKPEVALPEWLEFDMRDWVAMNDGLARCGTVACIGGTMDLLRLSRRHGVDMGDVTSKQVHHGEGGVVYEPSYALTCLFYDWDYDVPRSVAGAIVAIDRFLGGSKTPWFS